MKVETIEGIWYIEESKQDEFIVHLDNDEVNSTMEDSVIEEKLEQIESSLADFNLSLQPPYWREGATDGIIRFYAPFRSE